MRASTLAIRACRHLRPLRAWSGIGMAMSQNHLLKGAHAHINLVGGSRCSCSRCITGAYPRVDASRLALVQVAAWVFGGALLTTGVTLIYGVGPQYEPIAAIGSRSSCSHRC